MLTETLEESKHLCVLKPVGSGISEYCLRWILWKIMRNNELQRSQVCIVVGPAVSLADRMLSRIRRLFEKHDITFEYAKNYLIINNVEIFSVPSHNLNSLRSLENPSILYISEADYLPELSDVRSCCERYISKSNPHIIMESTINSPIGLYGQIFKEENSLYTRRTISYLDAFAEGMYTQKQIDKAKESRSFAKELLCDSYALGNVTGTFPPEWVKRAFEQNIEIHPTRYILAADPGYQPAFFGVCLLSVDDNSGMKQVIVGEEFSEGEEDMVNLIISLKQMYNVKNIFINGSDKRFIKRIKSFTRDDVNYEENMTFLKKNKILNQYNPLKNLWTVIPLWFNQNSSREFLTYARLQLEQGKVMIPSTCSTLEKALYNCQDIFGNIIKEPLSKGHGSDILDGPQEALYK
jgi:hypothetical protein